MTPDQAQELVEVRTGVSMADIRGSGTCRRVSRGRQLLAWLLHQRCGLNCQSIGDLMQRNASTVNRMVRICPQDLRDLVSQHDDVAISPADCGSVEAAAAMVAAAAAMAAMMRRHSVQSVLVTLNDQGRYSFEITPVSA